MKFTVEQRVRAKARISITVPSGSSGVVKRVLARSLYEVSFDQLPDGTAMPPKVEVVAENDLE